MQTNLVLLTSIPVVQVQEFERRLRGKVRTYCTKCVGPGTQVGNSTQVLPSQFLLLNWEWSRICASYLQTTKVISIINISLWILLKPNRARQSETHTIYYMKIEKTTYQCELCGLELHFLLSALTLDKNSLNCHWSTRVDQTCLNLSRPAQFNQLDI